jgi:hypothetical protein
MSEHIFNENLWQEESNHRKQIRTWTLRVLLVLGCLLILAWAVATQPLFRSFPLRNDIPAVNSSKLKNHVKILAEDIFPRDSNHPQNLDRAASYIRERFIESHGAVIEQSFEVKGKTYRNIIASFGPRIGERIIVGAHYDTSGELPGSDDNASGVAGLLELAAMLGNRPLHKRVDLVAFSLEEPPYFNTEYMGSAIHAKSLKKQNVVVRMMISLEMIGFFIDAPNSQRFPLPLLDLAYPNQGNFICVVSKLGLGSFVRHTKKAMRMAAPLPVYSLNAPASSPGINLSDHINYWRQGYDALMITDTAFMRNARYHTAEDKPDTLDYKRMAMVVQGVYAAVLEIAQK